VVTLKYSGLLNEGMISECFATANRRALEQYYTAGNPDANVHLKNKGYEALSVKRLTS